MSDDDMRFEEEDRTPAQIAADEAKRKANEVKYDEATKKRIAIAQISQLKIWVPLENFGLAPAASVEFPPISENTGHRINNDLGDCLKILGIKFGLTKGIPGEVETEGNDLSKPGIDAIRLCYGKRGNLTVELNKSGLQKLIDVGIDHPVINAVRGGPPEKGFAQRAKK